MPLYWKPSWTERSLPPSFWWLWHIFLEPSFLCFSTRECHTFNSLLQVPASFLLVILLACWICRSFFITGFERASSLLSSFHSTPWVWKAFCKESKGFKRAYWCIWHVSTHFIAWSGSSPSGFFAWGEGVIETVQLSCFQSLGNKHVLRQVFLFSKKKLKTLFVFELTYISWSLLIIVARYASWHIGRTANNVFLIVLSIVTHCAVAGKFLTKILLCLRALEIIETEPFLSYWKRLMEQYCRSQHAFSTDDCSHAKNFNLVALVTDWYQWAHILKGRCLNDGSEMLHETGQSNEKGTGNIFCLANDSVENRWWELERSQPTTENRSEDRSVCEL